MPRLPGTNPASDKARLSQLQPTVCFDSPLSDGHRGHCAAILRCRQWDFDTLLAHFSKRKRIDSLPTAHEKSSSSISRSGRARLLAGADPTGKVMIMQHPPFVEVTGQLFFDDAHVAQTAKGVYRGKSINKKQLPSKTVWEIHPITKLVFASKPK
jgi:hypothetical protein